MFLRRITLHQFRCYSDASFEFNPGVNVICGPNAQGKTSLLEAIYFLISGRSFRTHQTEDLIQSGASSFSLEATFVKHEVEQTLRLIWSKSQRKIIYNSTICPSLTSLLGLLQGVVITPDDVALVKGGPMQRRHFLDMQISQVDPLYVHHLTRYHRAVRQRNALLKAKNVSTLESWEHELANSAAYLVKQRGSTIRDLQESGQDVYRVISGGKEELSLSYKSSATEQTEELAQLRQDFLKQFQKYRRREIELGWTLVGPHKDDFTVALEQKEARFFASEGQQRSCVAALRFAEWNRMKRMAHETPLMLIDDVGVSLDDSRRDRLLKHVKTLGQAFLTTTIPLFGVMSDE